MTTKFQLIHYLQSCALASTGKQLPKWGFEQQEVSCNGNVRDKTAIWNIEDNKHKNCKSIDFFKWLKEKKNCLLLKSDTWTCLKE